MGIVEDLADELAVDALATSERLENEKIILEVSEILGASSTTAQEAYLTAIRVRRAEARARKYLEECRTKAAKAQ
ncbi:hypothetical protein ACFFUT_12230 [Pseudohalocynthiibacter aestuariivivens]|jgi:hypothetical protein|uniref:Uncharacterized protein n=1 Tax=Pseudohalocynthiibacter aestuariivivens TaxID=1591409 RepID=A0ABV5JIG1_9RHOB|nr:MULTISPECIES: hypothetical protein [Pseudohalocynthiibacter]MBS9716119.1 hypothetical protein [Pseudohalocynthiibacter aestuariivivens]MCK0101073.1 hypothetical protein [Pseudohalocynthiibacter sp. F2068]